MPISEGKWEVFDEWEYDSEGEVCDCVYVIVSPRNNEVARVNEIDDARAIAALPKLIETVRDVLVILHAQEEYGLHRLLADALAEAGLEPPQ